MLSSQAKKAILCGGVREPIGSFISFGLFVLLFLILFFFSFFVVLFVEGGGILLIGAGVFTCCYCLKEGLLF